MKKSALKPVKNILVTGAHGQLGEEIKRHCQKEGRVLVFTDHTDLDITDVRAINSFFEKYTFDCCINAAAYTAVDKAEEDVEKAFLVNAKAPEALAGICKEYDCQLIHISTDFVFDGKTSVPYQEEDATAPLSVYGKSKREGEQAVMATHPGAWIFRTSWLYSTQGSNFVKTMLRLGKEKEQLGVIADQIGTPTYAKDLALLLDRALDISKEEGVPGGVYHFSNEGVASWYDFAHAIFEYSGTKVQLLPINTLQYPTPATRPNYSVMDKTKVKETFRISIRHWREALNECINQLLKS
ncbi:dTDP-4-dehydrorhamnose reductase [Rapidithrix thailandica]|uniref:dTDP-4-dehydrorhamnose reductase n=1 Tax=Rapidithrix thailandica TaxID=413964 RepID=A0AAW9S4I4_9BACT